MMAAICNWLRIVSSFLMLLESMFLGSAIAIAAVTECLLPESNLEYKHSVVTHCLRVSEFLLLYRDWSRAAPVINGSTGILGRGDEWCMYVCMKTRITRCMYQAWRIKIWVGVGYLCLIWNVLTLFVTFLFRRMFCIGRMFVTHVVLRTI
jgi:hypothetical protein